MTESELLRDMIRRYELQPLKGRQTERNVRDPRCMWEQAVARIYQLEREYEARR